LGEQWENYGKTQFNQPTMTGMMLLNMVENHVENRLGNKIKKIHRGINML
jgi:hypothetical protein